MVNPKLIIFGTLAIGAAVAAAVTAAWAGYKTAEVVREKKPETKKEAFKETWKYWMPTVGCLGAVIVADTCLIKFGLAAMGALTGTVAVSMANRKKIMEKMKKTMNSEEFKKWKKEFVGDSVKETVKFCDFNIQDTGFGDTICYLECCDIFFRSDPMEVQKAIRNLCYDITQEGHATLLQFITDLNLVLKDFQEVAYSDFGWLYENLDIDEKGMIHDFVSCEMLEGFIPGLPEECYVITTWIDPYFTEFQKAS